MIGGRKNDMANPAEQLMIQLMPMPGRGKGECRCCHIVYRQNDLLFAYEMVKLFDDIWVRLKLRSPLYMLCWDCYQDFVDFH